jgi:hypothetical protein
LSHLFNGVVIALFDTYVIQFTWAFPYFIHTFMKHKDSSIIPWLVHSSQIFWPCHPNSQIHILQAKSFSISLISQNYKKSKMLNQPFSIACLVWLCCYWYDVFILCYFYVIACMESFVFCWEKWNIMNSKKASDTHSSTHFLLLH